MSEMRPRTQNVQKQTQEVLDRFGIEINLAIKVLIAAVIFGAVAAIVDRILSLPTDALVFLFGYIVAAVNGPTYAFLKGKDNLAGIIMSAVDGFLALLAWWIVAKILGGQVTSKYFADSLNFWKVLLDGIILGLVGWGWYAILRRLP
jgi:uncharacterized membrane protein YvlD (DUF360 family)